SRAEQGESTLKVSPLSDDPPRWTASRPGDGPEARAGERLRAAMSVAPQALSMSYARRKMGRSTVRWTRRSVAWAAAWVLFGMTLTAGAVTTGWWPRWRSAGWLRGPDQQLEVPAGSTLHVGRRGRWRGTLTGPAGVSIAAGDADVIHLSSGTLVLSAEAASV